MAENRFDTVSRLLPSKAKDAINQPSLSDLIKINGSENIILYIQFELIKVSGLVSVSGNLNDNQIQFIAKQLLEMFPNETLADFKICFERGCMGLYGQIYRMDGIVLGGWMEKYLDEKYYALEQQLIEEKDSIYKPVDISPDSNVYINQLLEQLKPTEKVRDISAKEIQEEGKERPKAIKHPSTPESLVRQKYLHDEWIRQNYDPYTGKHKDNWISEDEWMKSINE